MSKDKNSISLKKYVERRFRDLDKIYESKIAATEKALTLSQNALDRRLEGMNEFRESLKDQTAKYLPRAEYDLHNERTEDDIRILRESKAKLEGKASQSSVMIAYILTAISILMSIIFQFIKL